MIYTPAVLALLEAVEVHAVAHITGGGLPGNLPRVLPRRRRRGRRAGTWAVPRIFAEIQRAGRWPTTRWPGCSTWGVGMVVVVPARSVAARWPEAGAMSVVIGRWPPEPVGGLV